MAKCNACGKEMQIAKGCAFKYVKTKDGRFFERHKVGDEGLYEEGQRCGDCGALFGFYHHIGCDLERCPVCGMQLLSCSCDIRFTKHREKDSKR